MELPIEAIRTEVVAALQEGPAVVCASTGSGKSTQLPRWCRRLGRVLVVEPRRVACRSLAVRVAELEGVRLGREVGYRVRDDDRSTAQTEVLFATTGVVLRMLSDGALDDYDTVLIDEFHERSLDVDLILALLLERRRRGLGVMSATLDGEAVAAHLRGPLLTAEGRLFPVERRYVPGQTELPDVRGVEARVREALERARDDPGDVLVFLPGKAEIGSVGAALHGLGVEVIPLHGGLTLDEQGRAFSTSSRRRVILATNVAETSLTIPGVGVVIDSGLVRRTQYLQGRGFLTLMPIAQDSAEQRAGRAGRTAPGVCYRLWSESVRLETSTPPEIHRESLTPLVLSAASCGADPDTLPFFDPPKDFALASARDELRALGALDGNALTERGQRLFKLPLDPGLGRLLVEAEAQGTLDDAIDLVAALTVNRPLFRGRLSDTDDPSVDPRASGCDATARIRVVRGARGRTVNEFVAGEARRVAERLRAAFGVKTRPKASARVDAEALARTAIAADPRCVYVKRERKKRIAWSNGGTEVELAPDSAVQGLERLPELVAVLESRALGSLGKGVKAQTVLVTCAMPLRKRWCVAAGVGRERVAEVTYQGGALTATIERVHAKKVLETREESPRGGLARSGLLTLLLRGSLFREAVAASRQQLESWSLLQRLHRRGVEPASRGWERSEAFAPGAEVPDLEAWLAARLEELGVESGEDVELLSDDDLTVGPLPMHLKDWFEGAYPRALNLADGVYRVSYDLERRKVTLHAPREGKAKKRPLPPARFLPSFQGLRVVVEDHGSERVVRG